MEAGGTVPQEVGDTLYGTVDTLYEVVGTVDTADAVHTQADQTDSKAVLETAADMLEVVEAPGSADR